MRQMHDYTLGDEVLFNTDTITECTPPTISEDNPQPSTSGLNRPIYEDISGDDEKLSDTEEASEKEDCSSSSSSSSSGSSSSDSSEDDESVDRLRSAFLNDGLKSLQTPGPTISRLDAEISDILNLRKLDSERKRHADTITENTKVSQDNDPSDDDVDEDEEKRKKVKKQDTEVIESIPKKFRQKAALIIRRLRATGNFEWTNEHTVIIGGVRIPQSNIIDLCVGNAQALKLLINDDDDDDDDDDESKSLNKSPRSTSNSGSFLDESGAKSTTSPNYRKKFQKVVPSSI
ncbi:NAD-dependent protein deacetylase HST1-like [Copidosoma floridanum]|uniref:NAD-dependent protein deacetylase HST1-like n=1 Tax=Copidosoma floridanum TaxID=29053 RepID=UPI000C6F9786|nr:NAD-dependent protein deacetylase HST1-like [Copidosoma floridanum]